MRPAFFTSPPGLAARLRRPAGASSARLARSVPGARGARRPPGEAGVRPAEGAPGRGSSSRHRRGATLRPRPPLLPSSAGLVVVGLLRAGARAGHGGVARGWCQGRRPAADPRHPPRAGRAGQAQAGAGGDAGQPGAADLRLRGQLPGGHADVREHHPRLGPLPHQPEKLQQQERPSEPEVQGSGAALQQVLRHLGGRGQRLGRSSGPADREARARQRHRERHFPGFSQPRKRAEPGRGGRAGCVRSGRETPESGLFRLREPPQ